MEKVSKRKSNMFAPVFRKLFWKEFRMLWPLWVAVAMLCLFIDLGVASFFYRASDLGTRNLWILFAASVLPALYGLGSAGTQFAWELESGTFGRLRVFPVSAGKVVFAKLSWTVVSTLFLGIVLWGGSLFWIGIGSEHVPRETAIRLLSIYSLAACEAVVWGAILSMLSRSPLMATVGASVVAVMLFCVNVIIGASIQKWFEGYGGKWGAYQAAWPLRAVLLVLLVGVLIVVGRKWFRYWRYRESTDFAELYLFDAEHRPSVTYVQGDGGFFALCQQAWRKSLGFWIVTIFLTIVIIVVGLSRIGGGVHALADEAFLGLVSVGLAIGCSVVASNVFGLDQGDRGFRFFAHHGVSASTVWLSRVLLSGIFFAVPWGILMVIFWKLDGEDPYRRSVIFEIGSVLGPCVFMAGAFFSILCRSRVLAWVWTFSATIVFSLLVAFLAAYEVSVFFALLPALCFMVCSCWGVADQIHERSGWRACWRRRVAMFAVCMVLLVGGVITQRVLSVPDVEMAGVVCQYEQAWKSSEAMQALDKLETLSGATVKRVELDHPAEWWHNEPDNFVEIYDEPELHKLLAVADSSQGPDWSLFVEDADLSKASAFKRDEFKGNLLRVRYHLVRTAEYYSRLSKPEESLDCLLAAIRLSSPERETETAAIVFDHLARWSMGPGVTLEMVKDAIRRVEELPTSGENVKRFILADYLHRQNVLEYMGRDQKREVYLPGRALLTWLPWEHARVKRILKRDAAESLAVINCWEELRQQNGESNTNLFHVLWEKILAWRQRQSWRSNDLLRDFFLYYVGEMDADAKIGLLWQTELFRRLALASLAVRAYQLEQDGALPESIRQVAKYLKDPTLLSMPCGPDFGFCQGGVEGKQYIQPGLDLDDYKRPSVIESLTPDKPCIVLDTQTLYTAYGLPGIGEGPAADKVQDLPDKDFYTVSTVYPLPFQEKKQEREDEEE